MSRQGLYLSISKRLQPQLKPDHREQFTANLWRGPRPDRRWSGKAAPGWEKYDFDALPWGILAKKSRRDVEGAVCVKSGRSRLVLRVPLLGGGYGYAKRYLVNNLRRRVGNFFAGSKAEREFTLGLEMLRAGLPTPEPLVHASYAGSGTFGWVKLPATYLLTREWPNQGSFREWLRGSILAKDEPGARAAVSMLARFLACAHRHGFYHDDCSADHILVAPDVDTQAALVAKGKDEALKWFAFIDVDNGFLDKRPVDEYGCCVNLFQILRSMNFRFFPADLRKLFIADYLLHAKGRKKLSEADCRKLIEEIAHHKTGRSVFKPPLKQKKESD